MSTSEKPSKSAEKRSRVSVVRAPIDRWGYVGVWIRHKLLESIEVGTPVNMVLQKHRVPVFNEIMKMSSFLGSEDFFTVFAIIITWLVDARLGRLFTILLGMGFYCSSFFKNLLCLPRPPSPPVRPLTREDLDWAFPSNHGIMGVISPWYIWFYCFLHYQMSWPVHATLFLALLLWSVGVIFSRIYLGVHSPADMVGGGLFGVTLLCIYLLVDDYIDYQCAASGYVALQAVVVASAMFVVHPRCVPETQSFGETVTVASCSLGCVIARAMASPRTSTLSLWESTLVASHEYPLFKFCLLAVTRLVVGGTVIFIYRLIMKSLVKNVCYKVYNYFGLACYSFTEYLKTNPATTKHWNAAYKLPPLLSNGSGKSIDECSEDEGGAGSATATTKSDLDNDDVVAKRMAECLPPYDVDIPTRLVVYTFLGWFLCQGGPLLFDVLNI